MADSPAMRKFLALTSLLGFSAVAACQSNNSRQGAGSGATTSAGAAATNPSAPVARIGDQVITAGELDTTIKGQLATMESEHLNRVHQAREQALDELINKRLIEAKAKAENLTAEQWVDKQLGDKAGNPTDEEIHQLYDSTKASGRPLPPFEQVKGDIVTFLKQQKSQGARAELVKKLREENKVTVSLPPLLLPKVEVATDGPSRGDSSARVTIVEFSDYQCPFCSRAEETVKKVMDAYKGKIRLVYRDFPLPFHSQAQKASEAALCAQDQGKYWEMHEKLFSSQSALAVPQLKEHAKGLGLDSSKFEKCLDSGDKASVVEASKKAGEAVGVTGTPAFFINGRPLSGAQPFEKFKEVIDYELAGS